MEKMEEKIPHVLSCSPLSFETTGKKKKKNMYSSPTCAHTHTHASFLKHNIITVRETIQSQAMADIVDAVKYYHGKGGPMCNGKWTGFRRKLSGTNGNSDTHVHPDICCDKYLFPARTLKTRRKCCILLLKIVAFACIKPSPGNKRSSFFPVSSKCSNPQIPRKSTGARRSRSRLCGCLMLTTEVLCQSSSKE